MVEELGGILLDAFLLLQDFLQFVRNSSQFRQNLRVFLRRNAPQQVSQVQAEQIQHRQLSGVRLSGGHGDLGPRPGVDDVIRFLGDGAAHHVDDGQGAPAQPLGLPKGFHGV